MDAVAKRQLVTALFILSQAIKLLDFYRACWCLSHSFSSVAEEETGFLRYIGCGDMLLKWMGIELVLLLALRLLRVPRLKFTLGLTLCLWTFSSIFNILLLFVFPTVLALAWSLAISLPLPQPSPEAAEPEMSMDRNESHLQGSFTVKLQPWATARFSLSSTEGRYCLPVSSVQPNGGGLEESQKRPFLTDQGPSVRIPLELTGVAPWTLTYSLDSTVHEHVFDHPALLTIERTGKLALLRLVDGHNIEGRISQDELLIEPCPEARIDGYHLLSALKQGGLPICSSLDSNHPLRLWLKGAAPFELSLELAYGSTLTPLSLSVAPGKEGLEWREFEWQPLIPAEAQGDFLVRVQQVRDATGAIRRYGQWDAGDALLFKLLPPITAGFRDQRLVILQEQTPTIVIDYEHVHGEASCLVELPSGRQVTVKKELKADEAGLYRLLQVRDSLCQGLLTVSEMLVEAVHPPLLQLETEALLSPCGGEMGASLSLSFSGEAPFKLKLLQEGASSKEELLLESPSAEFVYGWRPSEPGLFRLRFLSLSDANYEHIGLSLPAIEKRISPAPNASFSSSQAPTSYDCISGEQHFSIRLMGTGPWQLEASLQLPSGKSVRMPFSSVHSQMAVGVGPFEQSGRHVLSLLSVTDASGCKSVLKDTRVVHVHPARPIISFPQRKREITIRDDETVPVTVKANQTPVHVTVQREDDEAISFELTSLKDCRLPLLRSGKYRLVSIRDAHCHGTVSPEELAVKVVSPPTALFPSASILSCRESSPPKVEVAGTGTIQLVYSVRHGHDETALAKAPLIRKSAKGTAPMVELDGGRLPGLYRYTLLAISDTLYSLRNIEGSLVKNVLPEPKPELAFAASTSRNAAYCEDKNEIGPFTLKFPASGNPAVYPLLLTVLLKKEKGLEQIVELSLSEQTPFTIAAPTEPGRYRVSVKSLRTALGCGYPLAKASSDSLTIDYEKHPSIQLQRERNHFCVGETARFLINGGSPPWTLSYSLTSVSGLFNKREEKLSADRFNVLLAEAGSLSLTSICSPNCCSSFLNLEEQGEWKIHPLPSATIGEHSIRYLRDGENTSFHVVFTGSPPFSLRYQRRDDDTGHVEDFSIEGIEQDQLTISVTNGGTYSLLSVADRYCQYPPV